jgi:hypothetical protein
VHSQFLLHVLCRWWCFFLIFDKFKSSDPELWTMDFPIARHSLAIVIGYMFSDLALGYRVPDLLDTEMIVHHFVGVAFLGWAVISNLTVAYQVLFLINEVSVVKPRFCLLNDLQF